jgi:hypothetical protein
VTQPAPPVGAPPEDDTAGTRPGWWGRIAAAVLRWVPWVLVAVAGAYGVLVRVWLLAHLGLFGDEAVVGLMGRGIFHGQFGAFYWGSTYGGAEPYVVAVVGRVNGGPMGLNASPALLAAGAAVLVYAVLATSRVDRRLAGLGAAVAWVWPYAATWNSVRELGFRGATLFCGLLVILCALRIQQHRAGPATRLFLGLAAGVGWWSSPEIVYFAVPTVVLLAAGWNRFYKTPYDRAWSDEAPPDPEAPTGRLARPWRVFPPLLTVLGLAIGALPWLYANIRSGFASVMLGVPPPSGFGYGRRVSVFFHDVLPTQLGLRAVPGGRPDGSWIGGPTLGHSLYDVILVLLVLLIVRVLWTARRGRRAAPLLAAAGGVVAFPFLSSLFPTSWYTADGRYGVYLGPLVVLLAILALSAPGLTRPVAPARHAARQGSRPSRLWPALVTATASVALAASVLSTMVLAHESLGTPMQPRAFFSGWTDPNAAARQVVAAMGAHHIRAAYGNYWTAYNLDLLAPPEVTVSPSALDDQRSAALARTVRRAKQPAWLFFSPDQLPAAAAAFSNAEPGPGGYTEVQFTDYLSAHHLAYRVVPLGVLTAVIPDQPLHDLPPLY